MLDHARCILGFKVRSRRVGEFSVGANRFTQQVDLRDFRGVAMISRCRSLPLYSRDLAGSLLRSGVGGTVGKLRGFLLLFLSRRFSSGRVSLVANNDVEEPKESLKRVSSCFLDYIFSTEPSIPCAMLFAASRRFSVICPRYFVLSFAFEKKCPELFFGSVDSV